MSGIFSIVSAANKSKQIDFISEHTIYEDALMEALSKGLIPLSGNYTQVKMSFKSEGGDVFGPYFYAITSSNGKNFTMPGSSYAFDSEPSKVPDGTLLGMFDVDKNLKNTPFYGFGTTQWKRFFEVVENFNLLYRQYTREQIVDILNAGGNIHVSEVRFMNHQSRYAFQVVPLEK